MKDICLKIFSIYLTMQKISVKALIMGAFMTIHLFKEVSNQARPSLSSSGLPFYRNVTQIQELNKAS